MTAPIRPEVFSLTDYTEPKGMKLREAVEWYKRLLRAQLGVPTAWEVKFMNERWAALCQELAAREGVPQGYLSYWLSELAMTEVRLLETAETEAAVATAYPQT